jgi:hypothetical protein
MELDKDTIEKLEEFSDLVHDKYIRHYENEIKAIQEISKFSLWVVLRELV